MRAAIIHNPYAGQVSLKLELEDVLNFLGRYGWITSCQETTKPKEATELARQAAERGAEIVIAAGGDGTINEVVNGIMGSDVALGVLPVGTTNVWALQMGIPTPNPLLQSIRALTSFTDLEKRIAHPLPSNYYRKVLLRAAKVLIEGHVTYVDVGEVSGRYFLLWAGIGLDAEIIDSISSKEKKTLGSWAYLLPALGTARRYHSTDICLRSDGKVINTSTSLVVVSNIQLYGGFLPIGAKARVNDGKLDVCLFKGQGFFTFVKHAMKVLSNRQFRDPKIEYYQCTRLTVEASRVLPVHVDGEPFTKTPIVIRNLPSALKVIVPVKTSGNLFNS